MYLHSLTKIAHSHKHVLQRIDSPAKILAGEKQHILFLTYEAMKPVKTMNSPKGETHHRNRMTHHSFNYQTDERRVDLSLCTVGAQPKLPLKMEHLSLGVETMLSPTRNQRNTSTRMDDIRDEVGDNSR